eukprot:tig00020563_g11222.t1
MPRKDGFAATREIRALEAASGGRLARHPVVDHHLAKPIIRHELLDAVERFAAPAPVPAPDFPPRTPPSAQRSSPCSPAALGPPGDAAAPSPSVPAPSVPRDPPDPLAPAPAPAPAADAPRAPGLSGLAPPPLPPLRPPSGDRNVLAAALRSPKLVGLAGLAALVSPPSTSSPHPGSTPPPSSSSAVGPSPPPPPPPPPAATPPPDLPRPVARGGTLSLADRPPSVPPISPTVSRSPAPAPASRPASFAGLGSSPPRSVSPVLPQGPPLHVLIAEDNPINMKILGAMLENVGWKVTRARDGQEAVEAFEARLASGEAGAEAGAGAAGGADPRPPVFSAILMDCEMPRLNGYQATARIRDIERRHSLPHHPIIAVTAFAANADDRARCLNAGMDEYTTKPVQRDKLLGLVRARAASMPAFCKPEATPAGGPAGQGPLPAYP